MHHSGMNRLFPLFCLCVLLPLCLLLAKTIFPRHKPKPVAEAPVQKRDVKPDYRLQLKAKTNLARKFALQKGFSNRIAFLLDMRLPSGRKRFFICDLQNDSVLAAGLVAHGSCNSRFLQTAQFANASGCGCSSVGRYKVAGAYEGRFGKAFKLVGLDSSNSNAYQRNVVLHAYGCVPDEECYPYPICNSLGCAMVSYKFLCAAAGFIEKEKKPVLLWIYD